MILCDASYYTTRVVLSQIIDRKPHIIYYASNMLNEAQVNYIATEEFLEFIFGFDNLDLALRVPCGCFH